MLTEICHELKNYFDYKMPKYYGEIKINNGQLVGAKINLTEGQYFRIKGSIFNDGVWQYSEYGNAELQDEEFCGEIWAMAIPREILSLSSDIKDWQDKYGDEVLSPYKSESVGDWSVSRKSGGGNNEASALTWQVQFASRLNRWRKI